MEHIVSPKLIRRNYKSILVTCGGKNCTKVTDIIYDWTAKGKDKLLCNMCGILNHFEIPI